MQNTDRQLQISVTKDNMGTYSKF